MENKGEWSKRQIKCSMQCSGAFRSAPGPICRLIVLQLRVPQFLKHGGCVGFRDVGVPLGSTSFRHLQKGKLKVVVDRLQCWPKVMQSGNIGCTATLSALCHN